MLKDCGERLWLKIVVKDCGEKFLRNKFLTGEKEHIHTQMCGPSVLTWFFSPRCGISYPPHFLRHGKRIVVLNTCVALLNMTFVLP